MIKWFAYIVLLLIFAPCLSSAKIKSSFKIVFSDELRISLPANKIAIDTSAAKKTRKQVREDKNKIKELAKAKRQPKPEKIISEDNATDGKTNKPKRQRRPEGMERPPEIPRRNGN